MSLEKTLPLAKSALPDPSALTFGGAATTAVLWGLDVNSISIIASTAVAVGGFLLQIWVAYHRVKALKRAHIQEVARVAVAEALAATAEAAAAREKADKVD